VWNEFRHLVRLRFPLLRAAHDVSHEEGNRAAGEVIHVFWRILGAEDCCEGYSTDLLQDRSYVNEDF
jgi:hypothetical protein